MPIVQENWPELLEPGLRAVFDIQRDALVAESRIPLLYNVMTSNKATETDFSIGGMGDWKPYNGAVEYDSPEPGFSSLYIHEEYTQGISIERKLLDDDQYSKIRQLSRNLAITAVRTREKHAASVFNNAFSASYLGGDSVALCGSHPYSPTNSTTQSNAGSTALSADAITATAKLMRQYKDDRGELVTIRPDTILVPPSLEDTAWIAVNTQAKVGSPNNDLNFTASRGWKVIVWDYLTDTNNWFLLDSTLASMYLNWFDRVPLEFALDPSSNYHLKANYRGYMRYSYGFSDWRFIYGHAV